VPCRVVVLVSGTGSLLQALLEASSADEYGATVVGVVSDREGTLAEKRAREAGVDVAVLPAAAYASRADWDVALTEHVSSYSPQLVVSAGFMKLVGPAFLERFGGAMINTHPALLPSFPGMHGPRDALEHGVKVTGSTLFIVDGGVDTGPIVAQRTVEVRDDDDEASLHERIKVVEREMLVDVVGRMAREGWTVAGRKVTIP
jgi:phosphoribosylglycinamide formyltransferase-1